MTSDGAGALRFGYPMGQSRFIMNRLLPEFYKRESALAVSLKEDSSSGLVRAVEDGELDLCLAYCSQEKAGAGVPGPGEDGDILSGAGALPLA